jgi:hypothetical protein
MYMIFIRIPDVFLGRNVILTLITVAARSKPWIIFARSNTGFVGLNPSWSMDVCVRLLCVCVCVLFCVEVAALRRTGPPSKGSYWLCIDQETEEAVKVHKGCRAIDG